MSGDPSSVERCRYCGKEFDVRRFQVVLRGTRGTYDSTECALLDAAGQPALRRHLRAIPAANRLQGR